MDTSIPIRAWRLTLDHIDLINEDVAAFKALDARAREFCLLHGTLPVFGIAPPYTMVLAGFATEVKGTAYNEDAVVLIGRQDGEEISCDAVALAAGTIPYEILVGLNGRIPR